MEKQIDFSYKMGCINKYNPAHFLFYSLILFHQNHSAIACCNSTVNLPAEANTNFDIIFPIQPMATSSCDNVLSITEILTNILLRLPAKDVTRCKCVSTRWRSLISAPWFCHSHTQKSSPSSSLWVCNKHIVSFSFTQKSQSVRTYPPFDPEEIVKFASSGSFIEIIQSCNGLLLCKALLFGNHTRYIVQNPLTDKSLILPNQFPHQIAAAYLVFDPLGSIYFKVISFLEVPSDDYNWRRRRRRFRIYVYSSATNSWNNGDVFFTDSPGMTVDSGVYCNGGVHWCNPGKVSMYFDVHEQCFKALPEPAFEKTSDDDVCKCNVAVVVVKYFGEYKGNLYLVLNEGVDSNLDFDVFKLKEDYSSWVVMYHVDLNLARDGFFTNVPFHVVSVFLEGNEEDWVVVFLVGYSKMVAYNLKDHTSRVVHEVGFIRGEKVGKSFHHYFETISNVP